MSRSASIAQSFRTLSGSRGGALDDELWQSHTRGMTMDKIAISLPRPLLLSARRAVRDGRASNVSAYVASAIEEKSKLDELSELLQEMLAETGGPLTVAERRRADAALGVRGVSAKSKPSPKRSPKRKRAR
jgi:hypothetical protein